MDLEAAEALLGRQREDFAWQQAAHPLDDDNNTRMGLLAAFCFPHAAYNMVATAYYLEDISDMPDVGIYKCK